MAGMDDSLGRGMLGCKEFQGLGCSGFASPGIGELLGGNKRVHVPVDNRFQVIFLCNFQKALVYLPFSPIFLKKGISLFLKKVC